MEPSSKGIASQELRIKIFRKSTTGLLEKNVNSWLSSNKVIVRDITYHHSITPQNEPVYSCMVVYWLGGYF